MALRRRPVMKPWNMLLIPAMLFIAGLLGRLEERLPSIPAHISHPLLLMALTVCLALAVRALVRVFELGRWPCASGVVTRSGVLRMDDGESLFYRPDIECSFSVDGREYTTTTLRPGHENVSSSFESRWRRLLDRYPVGAFVTVHYNPHEPSEAFLEGDGIVPLLLPLLLAAAITALLVTGGGSL